MLWWLSFVKHDDVLDKDIFQGVIVTDVPADGDAGFMADGDAGFMLAVTQTHLLGVNPGGEVQGFPAVVSGAEPAALFDPANHDRLLSREELDEMGLI